MPFHLGKPILAMLVLSAVAGAAILFQSSPQKPDLTLWVFAEPHARAYRDRIASGPSLIQQYQQKYGQSVGINLINNRALDVRLISLFHNRSGEVPDLVEVEISSVGKYFRPPLSEVGFEPLNAYLQRDGLMDSFVQSRFAAYSKGDVIFGIPHDVHPTTITYRKDLFDEAGIPLASARTWGDFQEMCLRFQSYWKSRGISGRWAIELPQASADYLVTMLLQRHVNIIDNHQRVHLANPKVADTVAAYAQMVAGPRRIGVNSTPGGQVLWVRDLAKGDVCAFITPDWRCDYIREYAPELHGKLAMMPMPVFEHGDAPTSTWGGTMMGIPRTARNKEESWRLLKFIYIDPAGLAARQSHSKIISPVRAHWGSPIYHQPDPFFGGQKIDELFVTLAPQIPARHVTPFTATGTQALSLVQAEAVEYVQRRGTSGLLKAIQGWLNEAAIRLERRIAFETFE